MIFVLGLGNPGPEYDHTRHNVGYDALRKTAAFFQVELKKRCFRLYRSADVPGGKLIFPLTYMNRSGEILRCFKDIKPENTVVLADNMDLAAGGLRIKKGGGVSGQKGINSISQALESQDFVRIYIGTGRPAEGVAVNDHVLSIEEDPQKAKAIESAIEDASKAVVKLLQGASITEIQGEFNRKGLL